MNTSNLDPIKKISVIEVAKRLGIEIRGNKAMCFGGHDRKTPSLSFSLKTNSWKCFGCGKGGNNINLVMEVEEFDFKSALAWFENVFSVDIRYNKININTRVRQRTKTSMRSKASKIIIDPSEFSADFELYLWLLNKCGTINCITGFNYLKNHGISQKVAEKFGVRELINPDRAFTSMVKHWGRERVYKSGLAFGENGNPKRLIWSSYTLLIPFYNGKNICYLQGRQLEREPKFLNLRGISKPIYNVNCLERIKRGAIIHICEGVPDALALESKGLKAVAILGASSFRAEWVDFFIPFEVVLLPDGDSGGESFCKKTVKYFRARGKSTRIMILPRGKDVADVVAEMEGGK